MCLILVAWQARPGASLIVAANRDEFHGRPAAPARFWSDAPEILGGRDLEAGGTWLGVSRSGRFAAVTNYRGAREPSARESRGALVTRYLLGDAPAARYVEDLRARAGDYSGFNLLAADEDELWWLSNRGNGPTRLGPGIHGLGNLLLDSPDVMQSKARFAEQIGIPAVDALMDALGPARILGETYGTRCSTIVQRSDDGAISFAERSFAPDGTPGDTIRYAFGVSSRRRIAR